MPTLNLMGGMAGLGGGGASQTPQDIQQLQAQAVQDPQLDTLCPGKTRQSTDVGAECWAIIWAHGGCNAANLPQYESWHQSQNLEVLVADVVQWANLPDERHQQGCYGDAGPPENLPAPPQAPQGGAPGGMGMGLNPLGLGGGMQPQAPQGPPPPPQVAQKIEASLQGADQVCPGVGRQQTAVGEGCWANIWTHVGCKASTVPPYVEWHNAQNLEVLVADAAQWASLPSETHRVTCYGDANPEL